MTTQTRKSAQQPSSCPDTENRMPFAAQQAAADHDLPLGRNVDILIQNHENGMVTATYQMPDEPE